MMKLLTIEVNLAEDAMEDALEYALEGAAIEEAND
jgi:hypothetical protein